MNFQTHISAAKKTSLLSNTINLCSLSYLVYRTASHWQKNSLRCWKFTLKIECGFPSRHTNCTNWSWKGPRYGVAHRLAKASDEQQQKVRIIVFWAVKSRKSQKITTTASARTPHKIFSARIRSRRWRRPRLLSEGLRVLFEVINELSLVLRVLFR
jgi:hypothetical protein